MRSKSLLPLAFLLLAAPPAHPAPPPSHDWQQVQAVPIGKDIYVTARARHRIFCNLKSVTPETLVCTRDAPSMPKDYTFSRAEIATIQVSRRRRSSILAATVGAGAGALLGGVINTRSTALGPYPGAFPLAYGFIGLFSGAIGGYFLDLSRTTIYRAP